MLKKGVFYSIIRQSVNGEWAMVNIGLCLASLNLFYYLSVNLCVLCVSVVKSVSSEWVVVNIESVIRQFVNGQWAMVNIGLCLTSLNLF